MKDPTGHEVHGPDLEPPDDSYWWDDADDPLRELAYEYQRWLAEYESKLDGPVLRSDVDPNEIYVIVKNMEDYRDLLLAAVCESYPLLVKDT